MPRVLHSFCGVFIYRLLVLIEFLTKWPIICLALGISPSLTAFLMSTWSCASLLKLNCLLAFFASAIPIETKQANKMKRLTLFFQSYICVPALISYFSTDPEIADPIQTSKHTSEIGLHAYSELFSQYKHISKGSIP